MNWNHNVEPATNTEPEGTLKEYRQIVEMWRSTGASGLAALVKANGSSYHRPGVSLLRSDHNDYAGALAGDALRRK